MGRRQWMFGWVAVMVAAISAAPAVAQGDPRACAGEITVTLDQRIAACNAIIAAGRATPAELATAYNKRGGAFYYKGEPERAAADYSRAIELVPDYADAFNNRCWANAVLGRTAQSVADCGEVLRLNGTANTFENRGFAYLKMGQFDLAVADYETALRLDGPRADLLFGRGVAKLKKGDASGDADIAAAKALNTKIAEEFASYGVR